MLTSHHPWSSDRSPVPNGRPHGTSSPLPPSPSPGRVLAVGADGPELRRLTHTLRAAGHEVSHARPGEVDSRVRQSPPDVVVALDVGPDGEARDALAVIREVRAAPAGGSLPLLVVTAASGPAAVAELLRHGADDCVPREYAPVELSARIEAKMRRIPVPVESLLLDPRTGLYSSPHFLDEVERELQRPGASRGGVMAVVDVAEMAALESRFGPRVHREIAERLAGVAEKAGSASERFGWDEDGRLLMLMPGVEEEAARRGLEKFAGTVAGTRFIVADENVRLTPAIGYVPLAECSDRSQAVDRARDAAEESLRHRDLRPMRYAPWMHGSPRRAGRPKAVVRAVLKALSPVVVLAVGVGVPFELYRRLYELGWDFGSAMYWVVVSGLLASAVLILLECLFSLDARSRPEEPAQPYPPASAVIPAYLPNEAATIVDTVESFLRLDYPDDLEIVLAYNTPHPLPVEETLREMARRDPRLVLLPVPGSTSKAQNINAAVSRVRGEFVGIFDADHHPSPTAFRDAWHWLSNGYDIVQGHCVIRNGESSWVAETVAVEFEAIYAVSHPGRTRMYEFGVFGGSNGFWRTDLLARTRMHGSMLTEDIDSSMRALEAGARIAVDRTLISRELAPTTLKALWNQRSRWAQGWLQVSVRHLWRCLRSPVFTRRQKAGLLVLFGWRELQPWLTLQILPVLMYAVWREGGVGHIDWAVPLCLLATLLTLSAGVVQAAFAWRLAAPELRGRRGWFWRYLLVSTVFYSHFKNALARQSLLNEVLGQRQWRVTPRAAAAKAVARR